MFHITANYICMKHIHMHMQQVNQLKKTNLLIMLNKNFYSEVIYFISLSSILLCYAENNINNNNSIILILIFLNLQYAPAAKTTKIKPVEDLVRSRKIIFMFKSYLTTPKTQCFILLLSKY